MGQQMLLDTMFGDIMSLYYANINEACDKNIWAHSRKLHVYAACVLDIY